MRIRFRSTITAMRFTATVAVIALLAACGDAIPPTGTSSAPSATEAVAVLPTETAVSTDGNEPSISPAETGEPTATPGAADTGISTFDGPAFRFTGNALRIPPKFTCDGIDVSPPLEWRDIGSEETSEFAIVVTDPDAGGFVHWVVARIPGTDTGLDEGAGDPNAGNGLLQGQNSFGSVGYRGPCPPAGGTHHYRFALYTFATAPDLSDSPTADEVTAAAGPWAMTLDAIYGH